MELIVHPTTAGESCWIPENDQASGSRVLPRDRTTAIERFLIMVTIVVLPMEDHIPTIGNFSLLFIMFGVLAGYVLLHRMRALNRIWLHPTFLAGYVLLVLCLVIESGHPNPSYKRLLQLGQMIAGGVFFATLCRDKAALRAMAYGYISGSLWLSGYLFLATYGVLVSTTATSHVEANAARSAAMDDLGLEGDLNKLAFLAAQGGVVALALTLTARSALRRGLWLGATTICLMGACLPMSRGGIGIAALCCAVILFTYQASRSRTLIIGIVLVALMASVVPSVVFQRMNYTEDGRSTVYRAAARHISDYVVFGVGEGNYWNSWAVKNGFIASSGKALGGHNTFLQMTMNWGLPALIALLALVWRAYRCIPKGCGNDAIALWIPGIALSVLLMMFFSHTFYDKWNSMGLGLVVGVQRWIWPAGIVK